MEEVGEPWRAMGVALGTRFGRVAVDGWAEGLTLGAGTAVKYVRGGGGDAEGPPTSATAAGGVGTWHAAPVARLLVIDAGMKGMDVEYYRAHVRPRVRAAVARNEASLASVECRGGAQGDDVPGTGLTVVVFVVPSWTYARSGAAGRTVWPKVLNDCGPRLTESEAWGYGYGYGYGEDGAGKPSGTPVGKRDLVVKLDVWSTSDDEKNGWGSLGRAISAVVARAAGARRAAYMARLGELAGGLARAQGLAAFAVAKDGLGLFCEAMGCPAGGLREVVELEGMVLAHLGGRADAVIVHSGAGTSADARAGADAGAVAAAAGSGGGASSGNCVTDSDRFWRPVRPGDEEANVLDETRKPYRRLLECGPGEVSVLDLRQYLFARRAAILTRMGRATEAVALGMTFVAEMEAAVARTPGLPRGFHLAWAYSAARQLAGLVDAIVAGSGLGTTTGSEFRDALKRAGDLYNLCRSKLLSLVDLVIVIDAHEEEDAARHAHEPVTPRMSMTGGKEGSPVRVRPVLTPGMERRRQGGATGSGAGMAGAHSASEAFRRRLHDSVGAHQQMQQMLKLQLRQQEDDEGTSIQLGDAYEEEEERSRDSGLQGQQPYLGGEAAGAAQGGAGLREDEPRLAPRGRLKLLHQNSEEISKIVSLEELLGPAFSAGIGVTRSTSVDSVAEDGGEASHSDDPETPSTNGADGKVAPHVMLSTSVSALADTLADREALMRLYRELTLRAVRCYESCGYQRTAAALQNELAGFLMAHHQQQRPDGDFSDILADVARLQEPLARLACAERWWDHLLGRNREFEVAKAGIQTGTTKAGALLRVLSRGGGDAGLFAVQAAFVAATAECPPHSCLDVSALVSIDAPVEACVRIPRPAQAGSFRLDVGALELVTADEDEATLTTPMDTGVPRPAVFSVHEPNAVHLVLGISSQFPDALYVRGIHVVLCDPTNVVDMAAQPTASSALPLSPRVHSSSAEPPRRIPRRMIVRSMDSACSSDAILLPPSSTTPVEFRVLAAGGEVPPLAVGCYGVESITFLLARSGEVHGASTPCRLESHEVAPQLRGQPVLVLREHYEPFGFVMARQAPEMGSLQTLPVLMVLASEEAAAANFGSEELTLSFALDVVGDGGGVVAEILAGESILVQDSDGFFEENLSVGTDGSIVVPGGAFDHGNCSLLVQVPVRCTRGKKSSPASDAEGMPQAAASSDCAGIDPLGAPQECVLRVKAAWGRRMRVGELSVHFVETPSGSMAARPSEEEEEEDGEEEVEWGGSTEDEEGGSKRRLGGGGGVGGTG